MTGLCTVLAVVCAAIAMVALGTKQPAFAQAAALVGLLWVVIGRVFADRR